MFFRCTVSLINFKVIKADALVLFMSLPDVEVVDSVTVSDEFDNKC